MKLKLLQSGQAQEHEKRISCLFVFTVMYCTTLCMYPILSVVTMDCFVVIEDVAMTNATGCRAI